MYQRKIWRRLKEEAQMIEPDMLFRYIRIFSELSNQLKYATQKRVMLEVALIKLCTPAMENTQDSLLDRIRAVEEKVEKGIDAAAVFQAQGGYGAGYGQDSGIRRSRRKRSRYAGRRFRSSRQRGSP